MIGGDKGFYSFYAPEYAVMFTVYFKIMFYNK